MVVLGFRNGLDEDLGESEEDNDSFVVSDDHLEAEAVSRHSGSSSRSPSSGGSSPVVQREDDPNGLFDAVETMGRMNRPRARQRAWMAWFRRGPDSSSGAEAGPPDFRLRSGRMSPSSSLLEDTESSDEESSSSEARSGTRSGGSRGTRSRADRHGEHIASSDTRPGSGDDPVIVSESTNRTRRRGRRRVIESESE
jgi:hypothetical protein